MCLRKEQRAWLSATDLVTSRGPRGTEQGRQAEAGGHLPKAADTCALTWEFRPRGANC